MCEMVEYASIRLRLVCTIATRLPIASESTASTASIICHWCARSTMPSPSRRYAMPNAASFEAEAMKVVTGVGAPW